MRLGWLGASLAGFIGAVISGAGLLLLPAVSVEAPQIEAQPPVLSSAPSGITLTGAAGEAAPIRSQASWERARPALLQAFEASVYGRLPPPSPAQTVVKAAVEAMMGDAGVLEEWAVDTVIGARPVRYRIAVAAPPGPGPHPLIVVENFCGNRAAFMGDERIAAPNAVMPANCEDTAWFPLLQAVWGAHTFAPPFEQVLARGYALALIHPGEIVDDSREAGLRALEAVVGPEAFGRPDRPGAVAAWAWAYSDALDALEADPRFDPARQAVWGHSRHGKAALLAAAADPRIDLVISLQAGTGGSALSRPAPGKAAKVGETVGQITDPARGYAFWFAPAFASFAGREADLPVDQHHLIALAAPRPVLIGAAQRDQWSDPHGSWAAAQGADPVYELYGSKGLDQEGLTKPNVGADLTFYMRNGIHGVTRADWRHTLDFLDAHFARGPAEITAAR